MASCSRVDSCGVFDGLSDRCCHLLDCFSNIDEKVYYVAGRILQATGILTAGVAIGACIAIGPISLLGLVPACFFAVLGTYFVDTADDPLQMIGGFSRMSFPPIVSSPPSRPDQPLGLLNGGSTCWLNAALQIVMHSPDMQVHLEGIPEIKCFIEQYRLQLQGQVTAFNEKRPAISLPAILVQSISKYLADHSPAGELRLGQQHDPSLFFERTCGTLMRYDVTLGGRPSTAIPHSVLPLHLIANPRASFEELLHAFAHEDVGVGYPLVPTQKHTFLPVAPPALLIRVLREQEIRDGSGKLIASHKCLDPFTIPDPLNLPDDFCRDGLGKNYECDSFILHMGQGINGGHHVAYIKKGGVWFYCSDSHVVQVAEGSVAEAKKQGILYHYVKRSP